MLFPRERHQRVEKKTTDPRSIACAKKGDPPAATSGSPSNPTSRVGVRLKERRSISQKDI
jgi:hypothetical protein